MKEIVTLDLELIAGGAYGDTVGRSFFAPELAGQRVMYDDGTVFKVGQDGMTSATEGLGPREALLQYRTEGPGMGRNSMMELADIRGHELLATNPDIDSVTVQASGLAFDGKLRPAESDTTSMMFRETMGQIFDDSSRMFRVPSPDISPEYRTTVSYDSLQQRIQQERREAGVEPVTTPPSDGSPPEAPQQPTDAPQQPPTSDQSPPTEETTNSDG